MSLLVAGACHDFEHWGVNNIFLIESKDPLAIRYNGNFLYNLNLLDVSVLESHHIAASFSIMSQNNCNILEGFNKDDYKRARTLMISAVLATDMSKHFADLSKFKTKVSAADYDPIKQDKDLTMTIIFHFADISNPTKPWEICRKWTDLLFVEFFHQGDMERDAGRNINYLMDRTTTNIA